MGTLLTAGAALLPDADHPSGTISHVLGPVSHHLCRFISWVSGGHRHGTHSLLFVVVAVAATWAGEHYLGRPFTLGLVFFLLALAVRSLHLCPPGKSVRTYGTVIVLATAGTFAVDHWIVDRPVWLPICVGLGCLAHLLGDCLTDRGCRLLWPFPLRTRVPLIERTGNRVETWVISPCSCSARWARSGTRSCTGRDRRDGGAPAVPSPVGVADPSVILARLHSLMRISLYQH